jgi:hypothetical protein
MGLDQESQACLNRGPLRRRSAAAHGLPHQFVININIGAHAKPRCVMMAYFLCIIQAQVVCTQHAGTLARSRDLDHSHARAVAAMIFTSNSPLKPLNTCGLGR